MGSFQKRPRPTNRSSRRFRPLGRTRPRWRDWRRWPLARPLPHAAGDGVCENGVQEAEAQREHLETAETRMVLEETKNQFQESFRLKPRAKQMLLQVKEAIHSSEKNLTSFSERRRSSRSSFRAEKAQPESKGGGRQPFDR